MSLLLAIILNLAIGYAFAYFVDTRMRRNTGMGLVGVKEFTIIAFTWSFILAMMLSAFIGWAVVRIVKKGGAK